MYAVYHGPEGLKQIADRVHGLAAVLAAGKPAAAQANLPAPMPLVVFSSCPLPTRRDFFSSTDQTNTLAGAEKLGHKVSKEPFFDTVRINVSLLCVLHHTKSSVCHM